MIDWLTGLDNEITLALNAMHTPIADSIMLFLSAKTVWIPLYVLLAVLMFIPKWYGKKSSAFRYGSHIGLTEQITNIVKNIVERPRPGNTPIIEGILHLPEGAGGGYGFFSAHASNTFGMAMITALIFRRRWYTAGIMIWASMISFSRIYLAKHFTTDVLCGALAGILIGLAVHFLYRWMLSLASRRFT